MKKYNIDVDFQNQKNQVGWSPKYSPNQKNTPSQNQIKEKDSPSPIQSSYAQTKQILSSKSEGNLFSNSRIPTKESELKKQNSSNHFQISTNRTSHIRMGSQVRTDQPQEGAKIYSPKRMIDYNKSQLLSQFVTKLDKQEEELSQQRQGLKTQAQDQKVGTISSRLFTQVKLQSPKPPTPKPNTSRKLVQRKPIGILTNNMISMSLIKPNEQQIKGKVSSLTPTLRPHQINEFFNVSQQSKRVHLNEYYLKPISDSFTKSLSTDYFQKLFRDHFYQTYQGIYFGQFFKPQDSSDLKNKKLYLRKDQKYRDKITVVFDLDETLVHCNENVNIPADKILNIQISSTDSITAGINIRPGAVELLEQLSSEFEIIVFTASHQCYAQQVKNQSKHLGQVIAQLDPQSKYIQHSLYRNHCVMTTGGVYTKDLRVFGDRSLDQLVLVDNASYSYAWQLDNGIPILPFYDNKRDDQLQILKKYLRGMLGQKDVREYNREYLKLNLFNDPLGPQRVFEKIFGRTMDSQAN